MKPLFATFFLVVVAAGTVFAVDWSARELDLVRSLDISRLPPPPPSPSNRVADNSQAAELGRRIFFDRRFSLDGTISCASCHDPANQFQDFKSVAIGIDVANRRTMPLAGAAYSPFLFWDGRADSLWSQALAPLENAVEHGGDRTRYAHLIDRHFRSAYEAVFGELPAMSDLPARAGPVRNQEARAAWSGLSKEDRTAINVVFVNIGKAIAAFERTIKPMTTRFDAWVSDSRFPSPGHLDLEEIAGLRLFVGKAGCINCHNGPLLTNHTFHNTGVPSAGTGDFGRWKGARMVVLSPFNCRGKYSDAGSGDCPELRFLSNTGHLTKGAFKTPGLRGIATRAPYMHAGQFETLSDVVDHYIAAPPAEIGHTELRPIDLTEPEKQALVRYLEALNR